MTSPKLTLVVAVAVLALASCGGSDSDGAVSTTTPSTSVLSETTVAPATTTTTSTPPSTTTAPTTVAPPESTMTEPEASTADLVTEALIASREAYLYAVYNLDAVDADERLTATHASGSPSLRLARENVQTLVDNGWLARPNSDIADTITIESDVTMIDDSTAELVACVVGAGEVYAPGAGDGGSDLIINGEVEAALDRVTLVLEDGRWKLREGTNLTTGSGTECVSA